uniref:Putative hipothetical protein n=1 Tax=Ixodes ricinus TaxID=34613 RepID=A0A147BNV0_IXORI
MALWHSWCLWTAVRMLCHQALHTFHHREETYDSHRVHARASRHTQSHCHCHSLCKLLVATVSFQHLPSDRHRIHT